MFTAELIGSISQPEVVLTFPRDARRPNTVVKHGSPVTTLDWVRSLPGRYWDPARQAWVVKGFGHPSPTRLLQNEGFRIVLDNPERHTSLNTISDLDQLVTPLVLAHETRTVALVRCRFAGFAHTRGLLPPGATWDKETQRFEVPLFDLVKLIDSKPVVVSGLLYVPGTMERIVQSLSVEAPTDINVREVAARVALSTGLNLIDRDIEAIDRLVAEVGDVPDWFGLDLFPFQRFGAIAAAAGRGLIADTPGLGKTRQALAAAAIVGSQRTLIVVPPVVVTHWIHEVKESGLVSACDGEVVGFFAQRKPPVIPDSGVVVVPDSLLVSRPALRDELSQWAPDVFIYDEAHRARTWSGRRSELMRGLVDSFPKTTIRVCLTGTPLYSQPIELAPLLYLTGHLDPVFGGFSEFLDAFSYRNNFKQWVARKRELPALKRMLDEHVWVRRLKKDVLTELPAKTRQAVYVDVNLADYNKAHREVVDKIVLWWFDFVDTRQKQVERLQVEQGPEGSWRSLSLVPTDDDWDTFARSNIGLISPLRKAAGVAKVPQALDLIHDWVESNRLDTPADDGSLFDRPYLVWAHHREVIEALKVGVGAASKLVKESVVVLDGSVSSQRRGQIVDDFQAGKIGVLIASITAAGVGVTLTRGSDMLFVETDWTPATVSQAEDRQARFGQTQPVFCKTMLAAGTLDERIQYVLLTKAQRLNVILGGDEADVAVTDFASINDLSGPDEVVLSLRAEAEVLIAKERKKRKS